MTDRLAGLKAFVKDAMPPMMWRFLKRAQRGFSPYHGRQNLDSMLEAYLDYDNGYFVELGANDGVAQANTLYFEKERNWHGVLIEPVPNNYLLCRANRSARSQVFCCACVPFDFRDRFVEIVYADLASAPLGLESDVADPLRHAEQSRPFLKPTENVFTFGAIARPLNDVLIEAAAPARMDLLSLDVEGAEIAVLKGIDHARFRFKYLCIESRSAELLTEYLAGVGYRFVAQLTHIDYLFADARVTQ